MAEAETAAANNSEQAPYPGSHKMPRWDTGQLEPPPVFTWRKWTAMLGPGLVMGGAAIGGGEWLVGPEVSAKYGGALFWLATLSILAQVIYNLEVSRYTLYCGEPIFTGKFRTLPGPGFWIFIYLLLDFGSVFPYLAANAATPIAMIYLGEVPRPEQDPSHWWLLKGLSYGVFLLALVPLVIGGKVYNSLRVIMSVKITVLLSFLLLIAVFYSSRGTWREILTGFVKFGNVPISRDEDTNNNGVLDDGEDWDGDGHLDIVETRYPPTIDTNGDGKKDAWEDRDGDGIEDRFDDVDGDGVRDGDNIDNIFLSVLSGRGLPPVDWSLIAAVGALVAIAGSGGLTNTSISSFTRDQGWGMGKHVGAIPSLIGGRDIKLSHVGAVFRVDDSSLPVWRKWYRHVLRDQMFVWMPACFFGLALPSMLSVEFLRRGTEVGDWTAAGMTADGVRARITETTGATLGEMAWYMTLFCGFLVLAPSMASTADGLIRRWVDVFWTSNRRLRDLDPSYIRIVYFRVLAGFTVLGLTLLTINKPRELLQISALIMNFALGFSCWHTLAVNTFLLPRELRPNWFMRLGLLLAGGFFTTFAIVVTLNKLGFLGSN